MFTLAHLSDLHATRPRPGRLRDLAGKRTLGWLSWAVRRRREHRPEILEALIGDLRRLGPDQVAITGDLTHLGLDSEIAEARSWLERVGDAGRVAAVVGNHDAYAPDALPAARAAWAPYLRGNTEARREGTVEHAPEISIGDDEGEPPERRPAVWIRGPVALVGLCSAVPTRVLLASGLLGDDQCAGLGKALESLGERGLFRVILLHHPPDAGAVSPRRALADGASFREVLARAGAELVLHGHTHRGRVASLPGRRGPVPVVGVASASAVGLRGPERRARYHCYRIEGEPGAWRVHMEVRVLGPDGDRFERERARMLVPALFPGDPEPFRAAEQGSYRAGRSSSSDSADRGSLVSRLRSTR